MTSNSEQPLVEVSPDSLDELMARDPLDLTKSDLETIVAALREQRKIWRVAEAAGAKKAPKSKGASPNITFKDLKIEDLEL